MSSKDQLEVRLAVLEEKYQESVRVQDRIFKEVDEARIELKEATAEVAKLTNLMSKYSTYNKFLWPTLLIATNALIAIIGFLGGGGHL